MGSVWVNYLIINENIGCGRSLKLASLTSFSLVTGKLTGKMRENGSIRAKCRMTATQYQYVKRKFPKNLTGNLFVSNSEKSSSYQGSNNSAL